MPSVTSAPPRVNNYQHEFATTGGVQLAYRDNNTYAKARSCVTYLHVYMYVGAAIAVWLDLHGHPDQDKCENNMVHQC